MSGWRPALRIARRLVRRQLGRSILIVTLVAVPIAGATVADGIIRTRIDPDTYRYNEMGTADAVVSVAPSVDVAGLLPAGSRAKAAGNDEASWVRLTVGDRLVAAEAGIVEAGDELTEHIMRLSAGRLPRAADEVLLSEEAAKRLGLLAGGRLRTAARVAVVDGPAVMVTGLIAIRDCASCASVVTAPGSALADSVSPLGRIRYAVDLPAGTDGEELRSMLTGQRAVLTTRESYGAQWTFGEYLATHSGWFAPLAGLGLLEIVLLAGAAFAVGARRQVRELGLLAANGATTKQLSKVMLAQGLVLGVLGAVGGVLLGAIVTVLGMPLWRQWYPDMSADLRFGWPELAVVAVAGVLACVVAAVVPAVGVARMRPVDALARRFRTTAAAARLPVLGVVLLLAGGTWIVVDGTVGRVQLDDYQALVRESVDSDGYGVMAGSAIMVLGLILVTPALVAVAGRFGARLPLSGRLAVRDAVRHRHRTVAAVAAVMIAVAGAVATAFVFRTGAVDSKYLPDHAINLQVVDAREREQLRWAVTRLTDTLPGAKAHQLVSVMPNGAADGTVVALLPPAELDDERCQVVDLGTGTPEMINLSAGRAPDAGLRSALEAGKVVVFDECLVSPAGTVRAELNTGVIELPAYVAERAAGAEDYLFLPGGFISARAATAHGWTQYLSSVVVTYAATADQDEVNKQLDIVVAAGFDATVEVDESAGLGESYLLLAGGSALIALLGVGVTAALAAAEGRGDLATLVALGAQPRRRRALAGTQALVISGLGTLLGLLVGGFVGYAVIPLGLREGFAVPWQMIALTAVGVPCVAALVAMLTTRSQLPMLHRRAS